MFDAKRETEQIVEFIRSYYREHNLRGAVLGISGGKDSAVAAGLFCRALGKENVVGLTLPCHSNLADGADARLVAEHFGFELLNIDLTGVFELMVKEVGLLKIGDETDRLNADINLKPRLRMAACYYMAALLSAARGGGYLVAGTSNACELYVGYFTKGGDSVHDIAVLADLTVEEVIAVGEVIGVPEAVLYKAPSDGLSGKSDEEKMGVTYEAITRAMHGDPLSAAESEKIRKMHGACAHKFVIPTYKKG